MRTANRSHRTPKTSVLMQSMETVGIEPTQCSHPSPTPQKTRTRKNCKCAGPCFYCGADLTGKRHDHDHFPVPWRHGGRLTVPACALCHTMKDRISVFDWPAHGFGAAFRGMPRSAVLVLACLESGLGLDDGAEDILTEQALLCTTREARLAFAKFVGLLLDGPVGAVA